LHSQLSEQAARFQNQIHALVVVLFPEFTQVFADPCLPTAVAILKTYPSARAMAQAIQGALYALLHAQKHAHSGHPTAKKLLSLASTSGSHGHAEAARSVSLRILCEQLEQTLKQLERVQAELEHLLANDPAVKGLRASPRVWDQDGGGPACGAGGGGTLRTHRPGDCLRWLRCPDQRKRLVERPGEALQTRQRPTRDTCSIWRPCAAFTWRAPPLAATHVDW
ncbi:MAG TPA: hypothetical protein VF844_11825, partial [Ktedonobacteraceae bacterium]